MPEQFYFSVGTKIHPYWLIWFVIKHMARRSTLVCQLKYLETFWDANHHIRQTSTEQSIHLFIIRLGAGLQSAHITLATGFYLHTLTIDRIFSISYNKHQKLNKNLIVFVLFLLDTILQSNIRFMNDHCIVHRGNHEWNSFLENIFHLINNHNVKRENWFNTRGKS